MLRLTVGGWTGGGRAALSHRPVQGHSRILRPVPAPTTLLDDLRARVPLGSEDRLLDLAAGTGQIAFTLAADVADVVTVDQESEAIEFGRRKAEQLGIDNIEWVNATAEDVALEGTFSLVAIGNAMARRSTMATCPSRHIGALADRHQCPRPDPARVGERH